MSLRKSLIIIDAHLLTLMCLSLSPHSGHTLTHCATGVVQYVWECCCRAGGSLLSCEASWCSCGNTTLLLREDHLLLGLQVFTGPRHCARYQITPYLGTFSSPWWLNAEAPPAGSARGSVCVNPMSSPQSSTWKNQSGCWRCDWNHSVPVEQHFLKQFVNDCRKEQSVHNALLHKHHVTGYTNSKLEI